MSPFAHTYFQKCYGSKFFEASKSESLQRHQILHGSKNNTALEIARLLNFFNVFTFYIWIILRTSHEKGSYQGQEAAIL